MKLCDNFFSQSVLLFLSNQILLFTMYPVVVSVFAGKIIFQMLQI